MSRTIEISTDVYAAIWRARKDGEETENDVLERLFNCRKTDAFQFFAIEEGSQLSVNGYFDNRNNVHFPEGFFVFRNYKGTLFNAMATKGQWQRMDTGQLFVSLNKLNESIVSGNENIWNGNWQYLDENGNRSSIDALRN